MSSRWEYYISVSWAFQRHLLIPVDERVWHLIMYILIFEKWRLHNCVKLKCQTFILNTNNITSQIKDNIMRNLNQIFVWKIEITAENYDKWQHLLSLYAFADNHWYFNITFKTARPIKWTWEWCQLNNDLIRHSTDLRATGLRTNAAPFSHATKPSWFVLLTRLL